MKKTAEWYEQYREVIFNSEFVDREKDRHLVAIYLALLQSGQFNKHVRWITEQLGLSPMARSKLRRERRLQEQWAAKQARAKQRARADAVEAEFTVTE